MGQDITKSAKEMGDKMKEAAKKKQGRRSSGRLPGENRDGGRETGTEKSAENRCGLLPGDFDGAHQDPMGAASPAAAAATPAATPATAAPPADPLVANPLAAEHDTAASPPRGNGGAVPANPAAGGRRKTTQTAGQASGGKQPETPEEALDFLRRFVWPW